MDNSVADVIMPREDASSAGNAINPVIMMNAIKVACLETVFITYINEILLISSKLHQLFLVNITTNHLLFDAAFLHFSIRSLKPSSWCMHIYNMLA
jgi:hypothetical protein